MTRKILVLASNPQDTAQLLLNREIREIDDALEKGKYREQFSLRFRVAVRVEDLQSSLQKESPRIVHFCGHGMGSQGLVLETNSGQQQLLDTQAISDLFKLFATQIECVVLNACYSQAQVAEISKHINHVIGTKREIRDDAAISFSKGFYEALGNGETVERAYLFGCNRIQLDIYGSSKTSERKLIPVYSEANGKYIELPEHEVIELVIKKPLNQIENDVPIPSPVSGGNITRNYYQQYRKAILESDFIARSPYKGLKTFNAKDKDLFFGRERLISKLIQAVNQSNFVLVLGASGSGKSSVVRAGVIPQIEALSATTCQTFLFTPNRDPFVTLHRSLLNPEADIFTESEVEFVLQGNSDTLTKTAEVFKTKHPQSQCLIFIDQFEELFTLCPNLATRGNFIQGLINLVQASNNSIKLILAMRSDFLQELATYPQFARIAEKNIHLVADMEEGKLRQAIEKPAAKHGVVFESGLVSEIIRDVQGQAGSLPLLQYTLNLLWQNDDLSDRELNIVTYRQLGGVTGALQKHVNEIYQQLSPEQQLSTKQILLRLVDVVALEQSEIMRTAVSKRAYKSEFTDRQAETVNLLVNKSLLVSDDLKQEGQSTVEIAHEALLSSWVELKDWISDARDTIALNNRLAEDAARWQELRNQNSPMVNDELWGGSKLEKAIELRKDGTFEVVLGGLSELNHEFIDASIDWRDKEQKEKVHLQQRAIKFLTGGLAVAVVAAGAAFWQRGIAVKQSKMAFARQLAVTSEWIRNQRANLHEPSVILALESFKLSQEIDEPFPEIDSALRNGLNLLPHHIAVLSHKAPIKTIKFSPQGDYLATDSRDGTAKLIQVSTGQEITTISHNDSIYPIKFSPNGDYLATRSRDGTAKLVQVSTGKEITTISHEERVNNIKFSPNGDYLATASEDGKAKLVQVSTGRKITTISHEERVNDIEFSPNRDYLATSSRDGTAKLVQVSTGREITTISHNDSIYLIKFSPNGDYLATASGKGTVKLVQVSSGKEIAVISHEDYIWDIKFSPNGYYLVTRSEDGKAKLVQVSTGQEITAISHEGSVNDIKFSPNGDYLATASRDGIAKLVQVSTSTEIATISHEDYISLIKFSPNGDYLATGSYDGTAKLVQVSTGREITTISPKGSVRKIEFSPKSNYLIITSDYERVISKDSFISSDHKVRLIQVNTGTEIAILSHNQSVNEIKFGSDGEYLATGGYDGVVKLIEIATGKKIAEFSHQGFIEKIEFSSDGEYLATASRDGTAKLVRVSTAKEIATISHEGSVSKIEFSPHGGYLATASADGTVKLVQVSNLKINPLISDNNGFSKIEFNPNGEYLAIGSADGTVKLVQVSNLEINPLIAHKTRDRGIDFIEFSPNGDYLVSNSIDNTVKLAQISTGIETVSLSHSTDVWNIKFSPQGNYLATRTGSLNFGEVIHTAKLVQVSTGKKVATIPLEGAVNVIKFSSQEDYFAAASSTGIAKLIQVSTGKEITLPSLEDRVRTIEFSPQGDYLATGSEDGKVKLIQVSTSKEITLLSHNNSVGEIEFSPNGNYLATGSEDGKVKLVQVSTGKEIATISHEGDIWDIEFSPKGDYLATTSNDNDGTVKLVQVSTGKEITTISHEGDIRDIEFSPDGNYLATGSDDDTAKLVRVNTGQITVFSHEGDVTKIEFSPSGNYLATRSNDRTVKLVQVITGKEVAVISHEGGIRDIEFSPKGDYLATISSNNVRLDLLDSQELIKKTCASLSQNLSIDLWQRYIGDQPYHKTCDNLPLHPSFLGEGVKLAQEGKIPEAIFIYKRAKKLEPGIDLNPNTENIEQNPRQVANQFFAPTKLQQGETLAKEGKISEAVTAYKKAQKLDSELKIKAESWNLLCRFGSIFRQAKRVIFACEQALELAPDAKSKASYLDSRGLARALTGDKEGAIADFKAYVNSPDKSEEDKNQRKQWIKALEQRKNPFTDELLKELKK